MGEDVRPVWNHEISEEEARWFWKNTVTRITHHWGFTSEDTSEAWIELHTSDPSQTLSRPSHSIVPGGSLTNGGYFVFDPDHKGLVRPTRRGDEAIRTLMAIDAFEKRHRRERTEYERLKRKFGESTPT